MQFHNVKPKHKMRHSRRVGRGGKRGTYSGRGMKGQKAHAGRKIRPAIRDFIKSMPKLRGEEFPLLPQRPKAIVLTFSKLSKHFKEGAEVTPKTLTRAGLLPSAKSRAKLLGQGEAPKKLVITEVAMSKSAQEKIIKAGGKVQNS